jgi:ABC-type transport system involved in multi-copper enzyme maturation permease subunit
MKKIFSLIKLRFSLLIRQKFGWVSFLVGIFLILIGFSTANVSYISPAKIFFDFALGLSFVFLHLLAIYLAAQVFYDEKDRRTLHLILVGGVTRAQWIVGNVLGLWLGLVLIDFLWLLITLGMAGLFLGHWGHEILLQVKITQAASLLVVSSLTLLLALILRPILAIAASVSLTLFLYSQSAVERIFSDPTSGHLIDSGWALSVLKVAKIFPPLEWFDLKNFVGYETAVSWALTGGLLSLGIFWAALLLGLSVWRFNKMDL